MSLRELRQKEVESNFESFQKLLPSIIEQHQGKYALMKNKEIIGFFDDFESVVKESEKISDNIFSIQRVEDVSVNLGFHSYA